METQNSAMNDSNKSFIENIKDFVENYKFMGNIETLGASLQTSDVSKDETNKENIKIDTEKCDKFIEKHIYLISPN